MFGAGLSGADLNAKEESGPRDEPGGMVVLAKAAFKRCQAFDRGENTGEH